MVIPLRRHHHFYSAFAWGWSIGEKSADDPGQAGDEPYQVRHLCAQEKDREQQQRVEVREAVNEGVPHQVSPPLIHPLRRKTSRNTSHRRIGAPATRWNRKTQMMQNTTPLQNASQISLLANIGKTEVSQVN